MSSLLLSNEFANHQKIFFRQFFLQSSISKLISRFKGRCHVCFNSRFREKAHLFFSRLKLPMSKLDSGSSQADRATLQRPWVQFPQGAGLFSSSILCNVSINRSLEEVQHCCFSFFKIFLPICAAWGRASLISTYWDI